MSLDRGGVIQLVADAVMKGESHTVDLQNYDSLVLVDIYRVRDHVAFNVLSRATISSFSLQHLAANLI